MAGGALTHAAVAAALREAGRRFLEYPGVLGLGIGVPYSDDRQRFKRRRRRGGAPRWNGWALKVFVDRKREAPKRPIPRSISLKLGRSRSAKTYRFRTDVVAVGSRGRKPRTGSLQAGSASDLPQTGAPKPGARFLYGFELPTAPPVAGLPQDFWYNTGTVGCLAGTTAATYVVTAGHVVADVYDASVHFPSEPGFSYLIGFSGTEVKRCDTSTAVRIRPDDPRTPSGEVFDLAAVPLPDTIEVPSPRPRFNVPDATDVFSFLHAPAAVLVERDGEAVRVTGQVEAVRFPMTDQLDGITVMLPETIIVRLDEGETTELGDSGAPVVTVKSGTTYLLGFHFYQGERTKPRSFSESVAAHDGLSHLKLSVLR